MPPSKPESEEEKDLVDKGRDWIRYSGLGFQMIGIIIVFALAGRYLDGAMGWEPYGTLVLTLVGVAGGLYSALREFL